MDRLGSDTIPDDVDRTVTRFLDRLDRVLPGRVTGLYLVGSVALGAYRPGRSDIDVVAVLDVADGERLPAADVRRLRAAHLVSGLRAGAAALAGGHLLFPGAINGVFSTISLPPEWAADVLYSPTDVTLRVTAVPEPAETLAATTLPPMRLSWPWAMLRPHQPLAIASVPAAFMPR